MFEKLEELKKRYEDLTKSLSDPAVISDAEAYRTLSKEHASLDEIVNQYERYLLNKAAMDECRELIADKGDAEMAALASEELSELEKEDVTLIDKLKTLLLPKDPNDEKNVIIELRAGTGGEEAALFGADLLRMYQRYAERHRLKVEFLEENMTDMGGVKEVVLSVSGKQVYSRLKFESGVHRVQRVPDTESQGRIHTSAATVAVLPEAEDIDVEIKESELRIDIFRSSGAGGQHVNKTESAIRITHLPTGIVVTCQDERSQHKNKDKAMRVLKSRLLDLYETEQNAKLSQDRKNQVGSGDRSERIRTYNFPQNRVTDHRIGLTLHKLDMFMDGDMDELLDALILADRTAKLST